MEISAINLPQPADSNEATYEMSRRGKLVAMTADINFDDTPPGQGRIRFTQAGKPELIIQGGYLKQGEDGIFTAIIGGNMPPSVTGQNPVTGDYKYNNNTGFVLPLPDIFLEPGTVISVGANAGNYQVTSAGLFIEYP